ncbi:hypothetical protein COU54_00130 [Candidatus Pacearchaeota archaeon CG10_big_fil_rev_8_21_14_0_10_31_24]|nr:MAG: hypothetical protein COU54_00130 [Candidatus Pacearchaeota archaeon CG10_big_fil_rev_8_21_14_0_10_31_24]
METGLERKLRNIEQMMNEVEEKRQNIITEMRRKKLELEKKERLSSDKVSTQKLINDLKKIIAHMDKEKKDKTHG